MSKNPTAGIGDPYWYEWSVGLYYIIQMLNPDSGISSVTLQSVQVQGLDDVVVRYTNGRTKFIQIKHSRSDDTLSFGDLVTPVEGKESLLKRLASAWKEALDQGWEGEATLYTNRPGSTRGYTVESDTPQQRYKRPALVAFWTAVAEQLREAKSLADVVLPSEWSEAWGEWCAQIEHLSEQICLQFMKSFDISIGQSNLDQLEADLLNHLAVAFGLTNAQARPLFQSLDHALRTWTTSRRTSEAITREVVFTAISAGAEEMVGDHHLPPPEPFFPSRKQFVEKLATDLLARTTPVTFLTGAPGHGKTSVISALANRHDPVIDLRFHAFRPITPETTELPADSARTATAVALWGDLLCQLRDIYRGRLAKFAVPLRNDFLVDNIDQMRAHVLRLSNLLAEERGRPTVIAIDGIDHAARAGLLRAEQLGSRPSLLQSLVPPDLVPAGVCFLISGQPADAYEAYPVWLKNPSENVKVCTVPDISDADILELLEKAPSTLPKDQLSSAVRLIQQVANGNTLSAVFAVYESRSCMDVISLQERLGHRRLGDGITSYYEEIWAAALRPLAVTWPFVGFKLASVISLASQRLTGQLLAGLFPEVSASDWREVLRSLSPLLIEEPDGFRVFHNDVRVHLTRQVAATPKRLSEVAGKMADYCIETPDAAVTKHADVFRLLTLANRTREHASVYSPEYVLEGWALGRSTSELTEQCALALKAGRETHDWACLHKIACAASTLGQLRKSLQWMDREERADRVSGLPAVLLTEGRVQAQSMWSLDTLSHVVDDALRLVRNGEVDRARGLIKRWFETMDPISVLSCVPEGDLGEQQLRNDPDAEERLSDAALDLLRTWGRVSQHTGMFWMVQGVGDTSGRDREALAAFFSGWLREASEQPGKLRWVRGLKASRTFFIDEMEQCVCSLADQRRYVEVAATLKLLAPRREIFSRPFQVQAGIWALLTNNTGLIDAWAVPLLAEGFGDLASHDPMRYQDEARSFVRMCFVVGWMQPVRPSGAIAEEARVAYFTRGKDHRHSGNLSRLMHAAAWIGRLMGACWTKGADYASSTNDPGDFRTVVSVVLSPDRNAAAFPPGYFQSAVEILEAAVECAERIQGEFHQALVKVMRHHAQSYPIDPTMEPTWSFLAAQGEYALLQAWFDHWLEEDGRAWALDIGERLEVIERLTAVAEKLRWKERLAPVLSRQRWGWIGYSGHKEYSVAEPLRWYRDLARVSPDAWSTEGLLLLAVSNAASVTGDNRLSTSVTETVVASAARSGVASLWRLMNAGSTRHPIDWLGSRDLHLLDGLAEMLEEDADVLSDYDLSVMWCIAIGALAWEDASERSMLFRLKNAILTAAERKGLANFSAKMRLLGPTEYGAQQRNRYEDPMESPSEELADKVSGLSITNAVRDVSRALQEGDRAGSQVWRAAKSTLRRLRESRPPEYIQLVSDILKAMLNQANPYAWSYDGSDEAYKQLFPLLSDDQQWLVAQHAIDCLDLDGSTDIWISAASENLDYVCWCKARSIGAPALCEGLNRVLTTHTLWIEGAGHLPAMNYPTIAKSPTESPASWSEFAYRLMIRLMESNSSLTVSAALRGLWALCQVSPTDLTVLQEAWQGASDGVRGWLLLLAERIASGCPASFPIIEPCVLKDYASNNLATKLQAWVVLRAYERTVGKPVPSWVLPVLPETVQVPDVEDQATVLTVPGVQHGSTVFSAGLAAIPGVLEKLEVVTGDDVDDLEDKLAKSLKAIPVSHEPKPVKERLTDVLIAASPQVERLLEVIYTELADGRWADVSLTRIAQALLPGDDPFVLLRTPEPIPEVVDWPTDDSLDRMVAGDAPAPGLEKKLTAVVTSNLEDDEVVLGAVLTSHSRKLDVVFAYGLIWRQSPLELQRVPVGSTFSGRGFVMYDVERFEPPASQRRANLMLLSGGLGRLMNQNLFCVPSILWQTAGGLRPSPSDPTIWLLGDKPVMSLQRFLGPIRNEPWDLPARQPLMQRWVAKNDELRRMCSRLGGVTYPRTNIEVLPFRRP